jgi:hypothetical protein
VRSSHRSFSDAPASPRLTRIVPKDLVGLPQGHTASEALEIEAYSSKFIGADAGLNICQEPVIALRNQATGS